MARTKRRQWWQDAAGGLWSVVLEAGVVLALGLVAAAIALVLALLF